MTVFHVTLCHSRNFSLFNDSPTLLFFFYSLSPFFLSLSSSSHSPLSLFLIADCVSFSSFHHILSFYCINRSETGNFHSRSRFIQCVVTERSKQGEWGSSSVIREPKKVYECSSMLKQPLVSVGHVILQKPVAKDFHFTLQEVYEWNTFFSISFQGRKNMLNWIK